MIYICVPAYDEARTIGLLVWKVRRVMGEFGRDYRILVFDDASTDDTREVLGRYHGTLPLKVIRAEQRMGYARGLEALIREAVAMTDYPKRDVVTVLQADFTDDPASIPELVKVVEGGADVVTGRPRVRGDRPWTERLSRRVARWLLGERYRDAPASDPFDGYRAYRIVALKKAIEEREDPEANLLRSRTPWGVSFELLEAVAPHARRIEEATVERRPDLRQRESRFRPLETLGALFRLRRRGTGGTSVTSAA